MYVCICCDSPVELVDVLYVSKQGTHLLWSNGEIAHINNVSQVVLEKQQKKGTLMLKKPLCRSFKNKKTFEVLPAGGAQTRKKHTILMCHMKSY